MNYNHSNISVEYVIYNIYLKVESESRTRCIDYIYTVNEI